MKRGAIVLVVAIAIGGGLWFFTKPEAPAPVTLPVEWISLFSSVDAEFQPGSSTLSEGETLSRSHCAHCHLRPEPTVFPTPSWLEVFQIKTGRFNQVGILTGPGKPAPGSDEGLRVQRLSLPVKEHREYRIPKSEFLKIVYFYLSQSPAESLPQVGKPAFSPDAAPFEVSFAAPVSPGVEVQYTLAAYEPKTKRIVLGDSSRKALQVLDAGGRPLWSIPVGGIFPTSLTGRPDGVYVVISGPTYESLVETLPDGQVIRVPYSAFERAPVNLKPQPVIQGLRFPLHAYFSDLNGDGADDILVEEFGMSEGGLAWYQKSATGYVRRTLLDGPGSLSSAIQDFDGDGKPDVLALVTQSDESIYLFQNQGNGEFKRNVLIKRQPAFGFDGLSIGDMDGNGSTDIVSVNGDNDLATQPLRNYHGVRVWENKAGLFEEAFFYPMHGVLQAVVRDFDGDGDLDIVAIATWPDFKVRPFETAVYLENQGGFKFVPRRIPGAEKGRWTVLEAADLDGDGDQDLIFGALYMPGVLELWKSELGGAQPLAYLVLKNNRP